MIENTLYAHFYAEPSSFITPHAGGIQRDMILDATQGRLFRIEQGKGPQPEILKSWATTDNGLTWRLCLQDDLFFHNGRKVTSEDLEFALLAGAYSKFSVPETSTAQQIFGAKNIEPGSKFISGACSGVRLLTKNELEIKLIHPNLEFLDNLAKNPTFSPLPREELYPLGSGLSAPSKSGGSHLWWKSIPVGAGPFKVDRTEKSDTVCFLERVRAKKDFVQTIRLSVGKDLPTRADILLGANPEWDLSGWSEVELDVVYTQMGIYFNFDSEIVRDHDFRRAIQLALDPNKIAEMANEKMNCSIVPSTWAHWKPIKRVLGKDLAKGLLSRLSEKYDLGKIKICAFRKGEDESQLPNHYKELIKDLREAGLPLNELTTFDKSDIDIVGFCPSITGYTKLFSLFDEGTGWVSQLSQNDEVYKTTLEQLKKDPKDQKLVNELAERFEQQVYAVPLYETRVKYWVNSERVLDLGEKLQDITFNFSPIRLKH